MSNQSNTITISVPVPHVFAKDGKAWTTSQDVANYFNRDHKNVLKRISDITESRPELAQLNFKPGSYTDRNGQPRPMFSMDRKGFTLLVFGFTGPRALDFKIAYIDAFEAMAEKLKEQAAKPAPTLSEHDIANLSAAIGMLEYDIKARAEALQLIDDLDKVVPIINRLTRIKGALYESPREARMRLKALLNNQNNLALSR